MDTKQIEALAKEMAKGVKTEADLAEVTRTLTKTLIETALKAELTDHLGYEDGDPAGSGSGNSRNGSTKKTVASQSGPIDLETPRDRNGDFDPKLVKKRQRRVTVIDDKIIPLYAKGMSTRQIASGSCSRTIMPRLRWCNLPQWRRPKNGSARSRTGRRR